MAIKSDNDVLFLDDESDLSYDEPHDAFESLYDGFKKLGHKYSSLKNNYACLLVYLLKKMHWKRKHALVLIGTRLTNLMRKIRL
jgi:hypothetical protein